MDNLLATASRSAAFQNHRSRMNVMSEETTNTQPQEQQETQEQQEQPERDFPLPPPSFGYLVFSLRTQAEMHLGLFHFGEEKDRPEPDLRLAQHTIDMLAVLHDKTKGNLSIDEERLLENSLTELRFRFVQVADEIKKPK